MKIREIDNPYTPWPSLHQILRFMHHSNALYFNRHNIHNTIPCKLVKILCLKIYVLCGGGYFSA